MLRKTCCIVGKFCGTKGIWNNCDTSVSSTMKGNFLSSSIWAYMWLSITQGLMVLLSWRILTYCICLFPQSKKHWITLFTLSVDGTWTYLCTPPDHTFFKNLVICWIYCKYPILKPASVFFSGIFAQNQTNCRWPTVSLTWTCQGMTGFPFPYCKDNRQTEYTVIFNDFSVF